jgi:two-component system, OmpR family, sensor kinase
LWVAAVLLISAVAVFLVIYQETGTQLRSQIDREISGDANQLALALHSGTTHTAAGAAVTATDYVTSQPYTAASRLLFALVPGAPAVSNHPEVFGERARDPGESPGDQRRENRLGRNLLVPKLGYSVHQLPDAGGVRIYERAVDLEGLRVVVGAGQPLELVERAQHSVAETFIAAGAILLIFALLASYLAGSRVSAPLRQLATVASRIDAGEMEPRMQASHSAAEELQVLAEAFNHMLDRLAEAFVGQRNFVADASHELRTPLTVIRGQLEVLAVQEHPAAEEVRRVERLVQAEISRVSRLVDDLLLLVQAERTDFLRPEPIELDQFVTDLWDGVTLTAQRRFELGDLPRGTLTADPDRLAQALRNLARNAIEHTAPETGLVRLEVVPAGPGAIRFTVIDDGPGIPEGESEHVFERFHRTDASRARSQGGTGLGLAIVKAITEAHGGRVRALPPRGQRGARFELVLPGYEPA